MAAIVLAPLLFLAPILASGALVKLALASSWLAASCRRNASAHLARMPNGWDGRLSPARNRLIGP